MSRRGYGRQFGRFSSAAEFEAVEWELAEVFPGAIGTGEIGRRLGPLVYRFTPRCGHEDCDRPEHQPAPVTREQHPADIIRPVLQRLAKRGVVERVEVAGVANNQPHQWRWIPGEERPHRRTLAATAVERAVAAQADLERRLGLGS